MRLIVAACGLASLAILLAVIVFGGMAYPSYDHARQFISELGATGSPVQGPVNSGFIVSSALLIAFWLGVIAALPRTPLLVSGALLGAMNGLGMLLAGVFACDARCSRDDQTLSGALHDLTGGLGYLAAILSLFILAAAARRWPMGRLLFPIGVTCGIAGLIGFGGIVAEPEFKGLFQRTLEIAIGGFTLCIAWLLLQPRSRP